MTASVATVVLAPPTQPAPLATIAATADSGWCDARMVVVIQGTASAVMVVLALELPTAISAMIVSIAALGWIQARPPSCARHPVPVGREESESRRRTQEKEERRATRTNRKGGVGRMGTNTAQLQREGWEHAAAGNRETIADRLGRTSARTVTAGVWGPLILPVAVAPLGVHPNPPHHRPTRAADLSAFS